jgi:ubiquinone/menaquinone biosynthesis C-methylase UbiE
MDKSDGQVSSDAAGIYENFFVPALFAEWAPRMAKAAGIVPGQRVLDVACGTGVVARECAGRVGENGSVAGLDINDGMLAMARSKAPGIDWRQGRAESLPFDDGYFDAVVSQFGLMFFADRAKAVAEMRRVLKPGGRVAVAVFDRIGNSPGYADMVALLERLFGRAIADELRAPYAWGDTARLRTLFADAGFAAIDIDTIAGTARFPSIEDWVFTDIRGWTLADRIDDAQYETLLGEAREALRQYRQADGSVRFASTAHIVTAQKQA